MIEGHFMSKKELKRGDILKDVLSKKLTLKKASELMGISYRQSKRILKKIKCEGLSSLAHGNRGKKSPRMIKKNMKDSIIKLYMDKYDDFKPTFFAEKLYENHSIKISREKVRQILMIEGLWHSKKKKDGKCHPWRERRHHKGELIQIDGSHHRWLEDRLDQEICFMGYIDDASSELFGCFYEYEGTFPALDSFKDFIEKNGVPRTIYVDRHSTYKTVRKPSVAEELKGQYAKTQFEKVMEDIDVNVIHALSPQAKGRIERVFCTLQDRLVKEMRLAKIASIHDANIFLKKYLPKFNKQFSKVCRSDTSFFREVPKNFCPKWTFVLRDNATILRDFTIHWQKRVFLLDSPSIALRGRKVLIKQSLEGDLKFSIENKEIIVTEITDRDMTTTNEKRERQMKIKSILASKKSKKSWLDLKYIGQKNCRLVK